MSLNASLLPLCRLQDMVVYESTFVGLQGLAALHPPGSQVLAAAEAALVGLLGGFAGQLQEVFGDDVLYQVRWLEGLHLGSCSVDAAVYVYGIGTRQGRAHAWGLAAARQAGRGTGQLCRRALVLVRLLHYLSSHCCVLCCAVHAVRHCGGVSPVCLCHSALAVRAAAAVQVSLLGDVPVSSGQASDLMGWKEVSRRVLLQRTGASQAAAQHFRCLQCKFLQATQAALPLLPAAMYLPAGRMFS
jgi:hypothetical protein